jgi:hypothetical protein
MAKGGKGFGNTPPPPQKKKKKQAAPTAAQPVMATKPQDDEIPIASLDNPELFNPFDKSVMEQKTDTSRGKAALDKMRREKAEQRNAELQKMKDLEEVDQMMLETGGEAAVIPEKVAQRMGKRMLPFVGIPLFGAMGTFVGFWYMATYRDMEFQPVLVAGSTIALLVIGLVVRNMEEFCAGWEEKNCSLDSKFQNRASHCIDSLSLHCLYRVSTQYLNFSFLNFFCQSLLVLSR